LTVLGNAMARPVKIAVAGAGLIGKRHIEHVVAEPLSELAAVVDPSSVGQQLAQQYGAAWFPKLRNLRV
jgi:predicted dehydrogenase